MIFQVDHRTCYRFSGPVFLEPHIIRLCPRQDPGQRLRRFDLDISPSPAGLTWLLNMEGNSVVRAWFEGVTDRLEIRTSFEVETLRSNPFDFILPSPSEQLLPLAYPREFEALVAAYRQPGDHRKVAAFAAGLAAEAGDAILPFLDLLCRRLQDRTEVMVREEGDPHPPWKTLAEKRGSCRDLAVLFVEACRYQGLAARFVSGYQEGDPDDDECHLHAWAEVLLPGGGWRGYDPTLGLAVADRHVVTAASALPKLAAPVTGTFRGTGVTAEIDYSLTMTTSDNGAAATR